MSVDAFHEEFEHIELFNKPALFTDSRIDRDSVPQGWFCYDLRGSDDDPGQPVTVETHVEVNHAGTVLLPEEIGLDSLSGPYRKIGDGLDFLGESMTLAGFCEEYGLDCPVAPPKYALRPASPEEAGLFFAMPKEQDAELGTIGHLRADFGQRGEMNQTMKEQPEMKEEMRKQVKSYFVIKDGDHTAWCATDHIQNVMDAIGVLHKVYQAPGADENIDNMITHLSSIFQPVVEEDVRAGTHDLQAPPSDGGILAVVDMRQESVRTMNWISARDGICAVSGDLFRFLGVYEMALRDGVNGVPNENTFAEKLNRYCFIRRLPMPEEAEESFTMTMGGM